MVQPLKILCIFLNVYSVFVTLCKVINTNKKLTRTGLSPVQRGDKKCYCLGEPNGKKKNWKIHKIKDIPSLHS